MRSRQKKPTIYDLSMLSGHSPSTVSAVMNGTWQKRRISERTAAAIQDLAEQHAYKANRQAQGLRSSRSGLIGLLLPLYDSRFFSAMAQAFEAQVRLRGLCPVVVSGNRDPEEEHATISTLISYSIESLFICGATDPDGLHELCQAAGLPHVNIDLPGTRASSVTSDNFAGGQLLTEAIIRHFQNSGVKPPSGRELVLLGGRDDDATRERIRGFHAAKRKHLGDDPEDCVRMTSYSADNTRQALEGLYAKRGRLPRALFINSSINLEGLLRFMAEHPQVNYADLVVGCYDYDPFASFLPFPVIMIRQIVDAMLKKAFDILDNPPERPVLYRVTPELITPRTALPGPLDVLKQFA